MDLHLKQDLHTRHLSYAMDDSTFIDIHEKDLPFGVRHNSRVKRHHLNMSPPKEAIPFNVGHVPKSKEEGAWLMTNLTGVQNIFHPKDDVGETGFCNLEKTTKNKIRRLRQKARPSNSIAVQSKKLLCFTELQHEYRNIGTISERAQINQSSAKSKESIECVQMIDKSIDTGDLSFWTYVVPSHESLSSDDESGSSFALETYENSSVNEDLVEGRTRAQGGDYDKGHSVGYEEYMTRVKESVAYIQMRTQMLHDLGLGEDPKCDRSKSLIATGKPIVEDKRKKEIDTSSMNSASIAVKQARQLAGLMHCDEQACDLHNIFTQLQYLGKLSADNGSYDTILKHGTTMAGATNTMERRLNIAVEANIGFSLFECLQQAHEGVQLILASIYHGKNNVLGHQAELILSDKPNSGNVDFQEHNLQKYLEWLQNLEDSYEFLGSTISNSLQEAEKLEDSYRMLQQELIANGYPSLAINNGSNKVHKKRGSKYTNKDQIGDMSGDDNKDGYESDSRKGDEQGESSSEILNKNKKGRKQSKTKGKKQQIDVDDLVNLNHINDGHVAMMTQSIERFQAVAPSSGDVNQTAISPTCNLGFDREMQQSIRQNVVNESSLATASLDKSFQSMEEEQRLIPSDENNPLREIDPESRSNNPMFNTSYGKNKIERIGKPSIPILGHQCVQTEDVTILSLDYEREGTPTLFGEQEVQRLQKEIMKLKKQLHFWRAKNWAENHQIQCPSETAPVYTFVKEPSTSSLVFYYDVRTGLNTMISLTELDPQMQNSIMKIATKPVQIAKVLRLPDDKINPLAPATPSAGSRSFCSGAPPTPTAKFRPKSLASGCDSRRSIPCEPKRT